MIPQAVRFADYAGVFRIEFAPDADLECESGELTAYLQQQTERGQYLSQGLRLEIRLDPIAWREVTPPERSPRQVSLVEEFLRQYPEEGRAQLRELVAEKQRLAITPATPAPPLATTAGTRHRETETGGPACQVLAESRPAKRGSGLPA